MKEYWSRIVHWRGWKRLFPLPTWASFMLFLACAAGLVWVFWNRLEQSLPAYILYPLSAYFLAALCIQIPAAVRAGRGWVNSHPRLESILKNKELRFSVKLYINQFIDFAYGFYKIAAGIVFGSAWIGADGIYNMAQALIQLFQILRRKKAGTIQQQWRSYRACGWLVLLMHLSLIGIVFQTVNWNRVEEAGEIMLIATAAFAFYKFISSIIRLAKDRKHTHPIDSSVRMLGLSQAIFAIFSLQAGLLHTFGTGESWEHWLNLAVGCAVCLLTVAIGIYMLHRSGRELKKLQETEHG